MKDTSTVAAQTEPPTTETVADTLFLRLSERWALATDGIQWIVQRARRNGNKEGGLEWRAVAFVASDKGVLHRVLEEKGAVIDPAGHAALRRLPDTFREWISIPPSRRFKVCSSAVLSVAAA